MQEDTNRNAPGACSDGLAGDYDKNGTDDLAISAPTESVGQADGSGQVYVLYGASNSSTGLTATGATGVPPVQLFSERTAGMPSAPGNQQRFGRCLAAADFNKDGYDDLVVGAPGQTVDGSFRAGAVFVIFGSSKGLDASQTGSKAPVEITMANLGIAPVQGYQDFGSALSANDYNKDGWPDLAIGAPLRNVGGAANAGAVAIVYGSANGFNLSGSQLITQGDIAANPSGPENGDFMASSLASGDLNGDGYSDLAIGVPGENLGPNNGVAQAGAVDVVYGSAGGLLTTTAQRWTQDDTGVFPSQQGANFGWSLVVGETNKDAYDDLIVGAPMQNLEGFENAGSATVIPGSAAGLTSTGAKFLTANVEESSLQKDAYFGAALALANLDGSDEPDTLDLLVGVPGRNGDGVIHSGAVDLIFSSNSGGLGGDIREVTQNTPGVPDTSEPDDHFGLALSVGYYNHNDTADFAVAAPHEVVHGDGGGESARNGAVTVLYSGHSLTGDNVIPFAQWWTEDSPGMPGEAHNGDWFGRAVV